MDIFFIFLKFLFFIKALIICIFCELISYSDETLTSWIEK